MVTNEIGKIAVELDYGQKVFVHSSRLDHNLDHIVEVDGNRNALLTAVIWVNEKVSAFLF